LELTFDCNCKKKVFFLRHVFYKRINPHQQQQQKKKQKGNVSKKAAAE
jgi:hypothetical protein